MGQALIKAVAGWLVIVLELKGKPLKEKLNERSQLPSEHGTKARLKLAHITP